MLEREVIDNHRNYSKRVELYKRFGYDIEDERKFIITKSYPLYGNILELGTGKGYFALALAKEGYNFTSIDISEQEQTFARLNIRHYGYEKKVNFQIEDAQKLSFKDGEFDIVFCVNMFHHLKDPLKVTEELIRVVSAKGKIILSDFSKKGLELVDKIHLSEGRVHKASPLDLNYTAEYLMKNNFNLEKHGTAYQDLIIAHR